MSSDNIKNVVITAGAAGIGLAMARAFMETGAQVAVCDIDEAAVAAFAKEHPQHTAQVADVTNESDMQNFINALAEKWQRIDVVCANAGIGGPAGRIQDLSLDEWQACLAVNLNGSFLTIKHALPHMQRGGLILITSSTAGIAGYPMRSPYATAKWGLVGLTKTLAMELGSAGIRVNALCPGAVEGERMNRVIKNEAHAHGQSEAHMRQQYVKGVSLKTWVQAQDIAHMAVFLSTPQANKISGQILCIDGHTETLSPSD